MLKAAGAAFSATIPGAICLAGTEAADAEGVMVIRYKQWEAVKAAGTTNGMVWKDFLAQCRAEQKAEPAAAPAAAADSAAAKEVGSQTAAPAPSTQMSAPEPAAPETSSGGTSVGLYYRLIVGGCHFGHQDYRKANRLVKADHDLFPQLRSSSILNSLLSKIKDEAMSSCTGSRNTGPVDRYNGTRAIGITFAIQLIYLQLLLVLSGTGGPINLPYSIIRLNTSWEYTKGLLRAETSGGRTKTSGSRRRG